jgi:exodeoxyribonuclease V beta subunit
LHLHPHTEAGWPATRQQRRAEEQERERLAYVALTRACHRLILAWGPARDQQTSPLVPWLFPDQGLPDPDEDCLASTPASLWRQRLEEGAASRGLALRVLDPQPAAAASSATSAATTTTAPGTPAAADLATGPVPLRPLDRRWGRSSYTSWTQASHGASVEALEVGRDTADSTALEAEALPAAPALEWPERGPLACFPRGATAGDCLHRILERVDLEGGFLLPASRETAEQELRRAGLGEEPLDPLLEGLERTRLTPFGGALGLRRVADLAAGSRLHELRFDLSLRHVRARELAAAFADHPGGLFGADYAAQLAALPIDCCGFLTGSIDLVFRLDDTPLTAGDQEAGRWWVADWKSNWLGRRADPADAGSPADAEASGDAQASGDACGPQHYDQPAMARLMARSHYPLQAHLYLVALHRYLQWRLPGYQPERHLGGYAYVFLRGTPGPSGERALPGSVPGMLVERPPLERLLALDQALGRPSGESL